MSSGEHPAAPARDRDEDANPLSRKAQTTATIAALGLALLSGGGGFWTGNSVSTEVKGLAVEIRGMGTTLIELKAKVGQDTTERERMGSEIVRMATELRELDKLATRADAKASELERRIAALEKK